MFSRRRGRKRERMRSGEFGGAHDRVVRAYQLAGGFVFGHLVAECINGCRRGGQDIEPSAIIQRKRRDLLNKALFLGKRLLAP